MTLPDLEPAALEAAAKCHDHWSGEGTIGAANARRNAREIVHAYLYAARSTVPEAGKAVGDDPACTDCGGTGITYQTERRCACQTSPQGDVVALGDLEEALRLAEVGEFLYNACAYSYGDGYTEPREYGIEWQWQQRKPDEYGQGQLLAASTKWHVDQAEDGTVTEAAKLRAALASVPAPSGTEPVAWGMFSSSAGCLSTTTDEAVAKCWAAETVTGISVGPLYRHPPVPQAVPAEDIAGLVERLRETARHSRNPEPKRLSAEFWTELAGEVEEAATALTASEAEATSLRRKLEEHRKALEYARGAVNDAVGFEDAAEQIDRTLSGASE